MRQWKDLVAQLREMCQEFKFKLGEPIPVSRPPLEIRQLPLNQQAAHSLCCSWDAQGIHTSMLSGLLSMMGMHVTRPVPRLRRSQIDTAMGDEHRTGGDKPAVGAVFRAD